MDHTRVQFGFTYSHALECKQTRIGPILLLPFPAETFHRAILEHVYLNCPLPELQKGLMVVGKMVFGDRRFKVAFIPVEIREGLKSHFLEYR